MPRATLARALALQRRAGRRGAASQTPPQTRAMLDAGAAYARRAVPPRALADPVRGRRRARAPARDELAALITAESGLCLKDTRHEVGRAVDVFRFAAIEALRDDGETLRRRHLGRTAATAARTRCACRSAWSPRSRRSTTRSTRSRTSSRRRSRPARRSSSSRRRRRRSARSR